jgi:hypothetical protein
MVVVMTTTTTTTTTMRRRKRGLGIYGRLVFILNIKLSALTPRATELNVSLFNIRPISMIYTLTVQNVLSSYLLPNNLKI